MQTDAEHCWMLHGLVHSAACCCRLLGVVVSICTPSPTWTQQQPTLLVSVCTKLTGNIYSIDAHYLLIKSSLRLQVVPIFLQIWWSERNASARENHLTRKRRDTDP